MTKDSVAPRGMGAAFPIILATLLLTACGPREPAPVISGGEAISPPPTQVIVQRGQTLSGIAAANHVPMAAVAEANHLSPPYRILVGQALIIPGGGEQAPSGPSVAMASPPPSPAQGPIAVAPLRAPEPTPQPIPLDRPPPGYTARPPVAPMPQAVPPAAGTIPSPVVQAVPPVPGTSLSPAAPASPLAPPSAAPAAPRPPASGPVASAEPPAASHGSGAFLWPVRGHVLESYGAGPDGTHNDGINSAAARGAPVQAADAGVVAYSGNELRGYGNLILIKHANGWISAYAHCDLILVKTGQKVSRGQVIARVGSTGNVSEPQLHFELRRGKHPVDPREYLAPLPSAANTEEHPG